MTSKDLKLEDMVDAERLRELYRLQEGDVVRLEGTFEEFAAGVPLHRAIRVGAITGVSVEGGRAVVHTIPGWKRILRNGWWAVRRRVDRWFQPP